MKKRPLFLFPGLACNERLYETQRFGLANDLNVIVPEWIQPHGYDQLDSFALRWAEAVWETYYSPNAKPENRQDPTIGCCVGGHSFGSAIAPFVGTFLQERGVKVHCCFRFSTIDVAKDIPSRWIYLMRFMNIFPDGAWFTIKTYCRIRLKFLNDANSSAAQKTVYLQVVESPVRRSFHVVRMLYSWKGNANRKWDFPIYKIHGGKDSVVPVRPEYNYDVILPRAGHGMMLTQGAKLNDLIREYVAQYL